MGLVHMNLGKVYNETFVHIEHTCNDEPNLTKPNLTQCNLA
jgi:hypothetical protein